MKQKYRFDIEQNTDEWIAIKVGMFSASSAADLLMDKKTKGYSSLIRKITEERITGEPTESKWTGNKFTERGHELEPLGIESYSLESFESVESVGVVINSDWSLCSPDGLIRDDRLLQIKCPIFSTQWDYILSQKCPTNYYKQMQFELFVTGRQSNIFYSWHPVLRAVKIELIRDEQMISMIEQRLKEAIEEVKVNIKILT